MNYICHITAIVRGVVKVWWDDMWFITKLDIIWTKIARPFNPYTTLVRKNSSANMAFQTTSLQPSKEIKKKPLIIISSGANKPIANVPIVWEEQTTYQQSIQVTPGARSVSRHAVPGRTPAIPREASNLNICVSLCAAFVDSLKWRCDTVRGPIAQF